MKRVLLVDISNSYTKAAIATGQRIGKVHRFSTSSLTATVLKRTFTPPDCVVLASVVPAQIPVVEAAFGSVCLIGPHLDLGVGIDFPNPSAIGADRLANAAGCAAHYGFPAIVVDFGTAVTFDVLSAKGDYIGGVIAPGLESMTTYLHTRTALLPNIRLSEPASVVGRTTRDAMLSGAIHGYRGLVREILQNIRSEAFPRKRPHIIATGGDAALIGARVPLFDSIDPQLTLKGLLAIAGRNS
jgi:type III pantothenate kinase